MLQWSNFSPSIYLFTVVTFKDKKYGNLKVRIRADVRRITVMMSLEKETKK